MISNSSPLLILVTSAIADSDVYIFCSYIRHSVRYRTYIFTSNEAVFFNESILLKLGKIHQLAQSSRLCAYQNVVPYLFKSSLFVCKKTYLIFQHILWKVPYSNSILLYKSLTYTNLCCRVQFAIKTLN